LRARFPAVGKNPLPVTFLKKFKVFLNLFSLYIDHTDDLAIHFPYNNSIFNISSILLIFLAKCSDIMHGKTAFVIVKEMLKKEHPFFIIKFTDSKDPAQPDSFNANNSALP
jgi:hypothetical protein